MRKWKLPAPLALALIFLACQMKNGVALSQEKNRMWMLTYMEGYTRDQLVQNRAAIDLSDPTKYSAYAGCNQIGFKAKQLKNDGIRFEDITTTLMACPDNSNMETSLGRVLENARRIEIDGHQMRLFDQTDKLLIRSVAADWD